MKFSLAKGPFLRSKRSTTGIMLELFAVLAVVWIVSVVTYSLRFNFLVGLRAILVVLVSLVTTLAIDVAMALIKGNRKIKDIGKFVLTSYSYVTAIIFALCLPVGVSYYAVVVGAIIATLFGKYVFGGFGYNIFNPAIIGRIVVGLAFGSSMNYGIIPSAGNSASYDFVSGATVTGSINWAEGSIPTGYDFKTLLFGNYNGAMGETFTILLVVAAIYLIVRGIVNYRLILSYLLTITGISFFLGLLYSAENVLSYTLLQLVTGGLMFGAVFMITDPVTSPKSMNGKIIFGIGAAALTMLIRVNSDYPEGVMFSIALMNMLNPLIDSCIKGTTFAKIGSKWAIIVAFFVGSIGLNVGFNALYPLNADDTDGDEEEEKENPNKWLEQYTISKVNHGVYIVSSPAFHSGDLELKVYIDTANEVITKVEVLSVPEHEREYEEEGLTGVEDAPYYDILVGDNLNLDFAEFDNFTCSEKVCRKTSSVDTSFDVEAGATYTSSAFIGNLKAVVETYRIELENIEKFLASYTVNRVSEGVYTVSSPAFHSGDLELKVYIDTANEVITKVEVLSVPEHEREYEEEGLTGVEDAPYYDILVGDNLNLDFAEFDNFTCSEKVCRKTSSVDTSFDVEAGATYTSSAFIGNLKAVVEVYRSGGAN